MTGDDTGGGSSGKAGRLGDIGPGEIRLTAELLVVAAVVFAVFHLLVLPELRAVAPETFAAQVVDTRGRRPPQTTTGWARFLLLLVVGGSFIYVRLFHTTFGERLLDKYGGRYGPEE